MSEESNIPESDGTWSGLKKTIIGTLSTAVLAGGTWVTSTLFNVGGEDKAETKTEQAAPAPVIVNVQQSQQNTQQQKAGGTTIIREKVVEKPVEKKEEKKSESEDAPW